MVNTGVAVKFTAVPFASFRVYPDKPLPGKFIEQVSLLTLSGVEAGSGYMAANRFARYGSGTLKVPASCAIKEAAIQLFKERH